MTSLSRYSGAVLVPVTIGVLAGLWMTHSAFEQLRFEADARVAASATDLILREMGVTTDALLDASELVEPTRPYPPAVEAALRGDTVLALGSSAESLELTLVYGEGSAVRISTGPFRPRVLELWPGIAGYRLALYLRGKRTVTTEPAFSPEVLHPETLLALGREPEGMVLAVGTGKGMLRAFQAVPGRPSEVAVLVAADQDTAVGGVGTSAPLTVLFVVLLLSAAAAWLTLHPRQPVVPGSGDLEQSPLQWALITLVPLLAGVAILLSLDRDYRQTATLSLRDQMSRAIVLVKQVDRMGSVRDAQAITGFDAALLGGGTIETATRDDIDLRSALGELRPPPRNFTSSGIVGANHESRFNSAARTPDGATLILMGPRISQKLGALRTKLGLVGILVLLPPLLFLWLADTTAKPRPASTRVEREPKTL